MKLEDLTPEQIDAIAKVADAELAKPAIALAEQELADKEADFMQARDIAQAKANQDMMIVNNLYAPLLQQKREAIETIRTSLISDIKPIEINPIEKEIL